MRQGLPFKPTHIRFLCLYEIYTDKNGVRRKLPLQNLKDLSGG